MNTIIIQARLGSSRFPGKVLELIDQIPLLQLIVERSRKSKRANQVVVATTANPLDQKIAEFCSQKKIPYFIGDEHDVLARFYECAKKNGATNIVRITADCPFVDPELIDTALSILEGEKLDYVSNTEVCTYPDGLDVEAFTFSALTLTQKNAHTKLEREHVTPYLKTSSQIKRRNFISKQGNSLSKLRWTVDVKEDLDFIRKVYSKLNTKFFTMEDVLHVLEKEPELMQINTGQSRNEGFYKSLIQEPAVPVKNFQHKRSEEMKKKALSLIPSLSQTFSKGPSQFVQGIAPNYISKAQGVKVWDVDGNEYTDYAMALGSVILGHGFPKITEAVTSQIQRGTNYSLPHEVELECAELLTKIIPCAEMIRFGKNGSDATSGAVRAARAITGREMIAQCGYHGWQDWYIGATTRNKGVPQSTQALTKTFEYNNIESLDLLLDQNPNRFAAIILEPVGLVPPKDGFLLKVKERAKKAGALLIFDEIVTGFRFALGGAQELYGVEPDMACFGKAMGNGYPISAVVGRKEFMTIFDEIFFSFTAGGEAVSLTAAVATIQFMQNNPVFEKLYDLGDQIKTGFNMISEHYGLKNQVECIGIHPRTVCVFNDQNGGESLPMKTLFQQECLKRGVLFSGGHNICYSHQSEDIYNTLKIYRTAMEILTKAIEKNRVNESLEGPCLQAVFRKA